MSMERQQINVDPERGRIYVHELIHGHGEQCYNIIMIYPRDYQLNETDNLSIHDSVAIFLNIFAQNAIQRYVRKIFGHSHETISRQFHEMLSALEKWQCICLYMIHTSSHNLIQGYN
ncbi:hypothetical protein YC2023_073022 [Brassica napus]